MMIGNQHLDFEVGHRDAEEVTGLGSCVTDDADAGCDAVPHVDCEFLADEDDDDGHYADRSKCKAYSSRRHGEIFTWYGDLGATRHMSNSRQGM